MKHFKVRINCPIWSSGSRRLTLPHRWIVEHISITHQSPNYVSVQTPCGNLIQFTTKREKIALWVSKGADIWRSISWILSVCLCVYVCTVWSCPKSIRTSIFPSTLFPPSVLHHLSLRLMCVFLLASLFPAIPHFPTLHSVHHSPATTWIETYLEYVAVSSLTNRPKSAKSSVLRQYFVCYLLSHSLLHTG